MMRTTGDSGWDPRLRITDDLSVLTLWSNLYNYEAQNSLLPFVSQDEKFPWGLSRICPDSWH